MQMWYFPFRIHDSLAKFWLIDSKQIWPDWCSKSKTFLISEKSHLVLIVTMSIEIESADVVRLIQQYLKESNLTRTLSVIQVRTLIDVITIVIRATFTANQSFS